MNYFEPDYEPSELDGEVFLSEVPLTMLLQAIESQFQNPTEYRRKDYVQSFITKLEHCRKVEDEETKEELDGYYGTFTRFMEDILAESFHVGFPTLENLPEDEALDLIHMTYRFFIKNIKKNFRNLIFSYVGAHKDELVENLEERRDVTYLNFKGQIDNDDDVLLLSNLSAVIEEILTIDFSVSEFLNLADDGDSLECEFLQDRYEDFEITGNFVPSYIAKVDEDFRNALETKLRNHILSNYSDRKKIKKIITDAEELGIEDDD